MTVFKILLYHRSYWHVRQTRGRGIESERRSLVRNSRQVSLRARVIDDRPHCHKRLRTLSTPTSLLHHLCSPFFSFEHKHHVRIDALNSPNGSTRYHTKDALSCPPPQLTVHLRSQTNFRTRPFPRRSGSMDLKLHVEARRTHDAHTRSGQHWSRNATTDEERDGQGPARGAASESGGQEGRYAICSVCSPPYITHTPHSRTHLGLHTQRNHCEDRRKTSYFKI